MQSKMRSVSLSVIESWETNIGEAVGRLTTMEMIKKLSATTAMLSRHVSPTAITLAPNCHVAALKASDIQYAMKLVTPHFLSWGGTGSRSLLVLFTS